MLPSEWSPLNGRVGYTARRINGKHAPRDVDVAMQIVAIASYKKGVWCVAFSTQNLQNFAVDLSLSFSNCLHKHGRP
jgi:hypothetical protein